jgi:hypothetical protein
LGGGDTPRAEEGERSLSKQRMGKVAFRPEKGEESFTELKKGRVHSQN